MRVEHNIGTYQYAISVTSNETARIRRFEGLFYQSYDGKQQSDGIYGKRACQMQAKKQGNL